jgi:hypothetical protein
MRIKQHVTKTRNIGGFQMEMQIANIRNEGKFQATYYKLAEPFIWSEVYATELEAIEALDKLVDEYATKYPLSYGERKF